MKYKTVKKAYKMAFGTPVPVKNTMTVNFKPEDDTKILSAVNKPITGGLMAKALREHTPITAEDIEKSSENLKNSETPRVLNWKKRRLLGALKTIRRRQKATSKTRVEK